MPKWDITDNRCQLCKNAVGTVAHRFTCSSLVPSGGWPKPPLTADKLLCKLDTQRKLLLMHRGLLCLRLPPAPSIQEGQFRWLLPPDADHPDLDTAVRYCDGSLLFGAWKAIRATGFGIVVAAASGRLLAYGFGIPPSWCATAAAAEAWALHIVISMCPTPPNMRTDCQALVTTARHGLASATRASRPLARIWKMLGANAGCDISCIVSDGRLVWMPAHLSRKMVGEVKLGNGQRLSHIDWRANRLVDKLAKLAAWAAADNTSCFEVLKGGEAAAAHAAIVLGIVTHAANNHRTADRQPDGSVKHTVLRDSVDKPKHTATRHQAAPREALDESSDSPCGPQERQPSSAGNAGSGRPVLAPPPVSKAAAVTRHVAPWTEVSGPTPLQTHKREQRQHSLRRAHEIGERLTPSGSVRPVEAVQQRILARVRGAQLGPSLAVASPWDMLD